MNSNRSDQNFLNFYSDLQQNKLPNTRLVAVSELIYMLPNIIIVLS